MHTHNRSRNESAARTPNTLPGPSGRRSFLRASIACAGALVLEGLPGPAFAARGGGGGGGGGGSGTVTRHPLHIPHTFAPADYTLTAAQTTVDLASGGSPSKVLAYNGLMPGPTFRANSGDGVSVTLDNGLADETTVHWHGMLVPTDQDGQPQDVVMPGDSRLYSYTIGQRAALNWYHPHPHMMTGEQVCLGLAGAFIVNDAEEAALGLPDGDYEVPLIIRDANFDKAGNLIYNPRTSGFSGSTPLVNGTRSPYLEVNQSLYRFRVLNGANARLFKLVLSNGASFVLTGNDGGLLPSRVNVAQIEFSPGERLDVLIDFRSIAVDAKVMLRDLNAGWDLLEFRVVAGSSGVDLPPAMLSTITPLTSPMRTRTFSFDGMSRINGREFEHDRIDFTVPFNDTEHWVFTTNGNAPHPVHVHGASFQVISRSGGRGQLFPWEGGWKDTVLLHDQERVDVLIRFDAYPGRYIIHCHKLEHEDMGMMANFVVVA